MTKAKIYLEQALHIGQKIGDRRGEANSFNNLGLVFFQIGNYLYARTYYDQALCIYREISNRWGEYIVLCNISLLVHHLADDQAAYKYSQQALSIAQDLGDREGQGYALTDLGRALAAQGRLIEAADAYQQAFVLRSELGEHNLAIESLAGLAHISLAQNKLPQALVQVEEVLSYLGDNTPSAGHGLDGTEEPFRIYLTCYRILRAIQDPRAEVVLKTAYTLLQERAAKISDQTMLHSYLKNVAVHRELIVEFEKSQKKIK